MNPKDLKQIMKQAIKEYMETEGIQLIRNEFVKVLRKSNSLNSLQELKTVKKQTPQERKIELLKNKQLETLKELKRLENLTKQEMSKNPTQNRQKQVQPLIQKKQVSNKVREVFEKHNPKSLFEEMASQTLLSDEDLMYMGDKNQKVQKKQNVDFDDSEDYEEQRMPANPNKYKNIVNEDQLANEDLDLNSLPGKIGKFINNPNHNRHVVDVMKKKNILDDNDN